MRGWLEPIGDASANTYWLRRGVLIAVAIGLILALIWGVGQLFGPSSTTGTPQNSAGVQVDPADSTDPTAGDPTAGDPQPAPADAATDTGTEAAPAPAPTEPGSCRVNSLSARVEGANPLPVGEAAAFKITIVTAQDVCVLDLGVEPVQLAITSGNDQIWSTASCPEWRPGGQFTLTPDQPAAFEIGWPNRRADGCGLVDAQLGAGTYVASFTLGQHTTRFVFQIG